MKIWSSIACLVLVVSTCASMHAAPVYLNDANITVSLGSSMPPEPFQNRTTAQSLASVIDASSASAPEFHDQSTHVWVSGGMLELVFNFGIEYDLTTFHFWNYHSEGYDVDDIDLTFRDASMNLVGSILDVAPALGNVAGSDGSPILAEDITLSFPSKVQYVTAILSGSNGEVDFNNIGFTGDVTISTVPEPTAWMLTAIGVLLLAILRLRANGKAVRVGR